MSVQFDGAGGGTYAGASYGPSLTLVPFAGQASYAVNTDGSYLLTLVDGAGNISLFGGALDVQAVGAPIAAISVNGAGVISGSASCTGQKQ